MLRLNAANFERRVLKSKVPVLVLLIGSLKWRSRSLKQTCYDAQGWMADAAEKRPGRLLIGRLDALREDTYHLRGFPKPQGWQLPYLLLYRPGLPPEGFRLRDCADARDREFIKWYGRELVPEYDIPRLVAAGFISVPWYAYEALFTRWIDGLLPMD